MSSTWYASILILILGVWLITAAAQQPAPAAPGSAREMAQADLTGYWVAQVTEDWRWRMMTPPKGDFMGVPLNAAGRKVADGWDPARDAASGSLCRSFGAGGLMRHPMRIRISWRDDNTLQLETDLGRQTRLFRFTPTPPSGPRSLQGYSVALWTRAVIPARGGAAGAGRGGDAGRGGGEAGRATEGRAAGEGARGRGAVTPPPGGLKVVTTNLLPGYLRKNGIPYSENATVTEYYDRVSFFGTDYVQLVTTVEDPTYLERPFIVSNHFKREPDGSKWNPQPCTVDAPAGALRREPFVAQQQ